MLITVLNFEHFASFHNLNEVTIHFATTACLYVVMDLITILFLFKNAAEWKLAYVEIYIF